MPSKNNTLQLQTVRPSLHLPAHEHAARQRRRQAEHLPAIPGHRSPRPSRPTIPTGRKTFDTRIASCPCTF